MIESGAAVQLVDAHGVPVAELPVTHTVRDGESITLTLDVVLTQAAGDAMAAALLTRILESAAVDTAPGRNAELSLGGLVVRLTTREISWLRYRHPKLWEYGR